MIVGMWVAQTASRPISLHLDRMHYSLRKLWLTKPGELVVIISVSLVTQLIDWLIN